MASSVSCSSNNPDKSTYPTDSIQISTRKYLVDLNKFTELKILEKTVSKFGFEGSELEGQISILFSHFIQYLDPINIRMLNLEIGKSLKLVSHKEGRFDEALNRFPNKTLQEKGCSILKSLKKCRDVESFNLEELDSQSNFIDAYEFGRCANSSGLKNLLDSNSVSDIKKKIILQFVLGAYKEGYDLLVYQLEDCLDENIQNLLDAIRSKTYFEASKILSHIPVFSFQFQVEEIIIADFVDNFDELEINKQNEFLEFLSDYGTQLVAIKAGEKGRCRVLDALLKLKISNNEKDKIIETFINLFCENGHINFPSKFFNQISSENIKGLLKERLDQAKEDNLKGLISN